MTLSNDKIYRAYVATSWFDDKKTPAGSIKEIDEDLCEIDNTNHFNVRYIVGISRNLPSLRLKILQYLILENYLGFLNESYYKEIDELTECISDPSYEIEENKYDTIDNMKKGFTLEMVRDKLKSDGDRLKTVLKKGIRNNGVSKEDYEYFISPAFCDAEISKVVIEELKIDY